MSLLLLSLVLVLVLVLVFVLVANGRYVKKNGKVGRSSLW
jgi:hypothetical protein